MTVGSIGSASNDQMALALGNLSLQAGVHSQQGLEKMIATFKESQKSMEELLRGLERQNQLLADRVTQLEAALKEEQTAHQKVHEAVQQGLTQLQSSLEKSAQGSQANLQALRQEFTTFKEGYARHVHLPLPSRPPLPIPFHSKQFLYVPFTVNGGVTAPVIQAPSAVGITGTPATLDPGGNIFVKR